MSPVEILLAPTRDGRWRARVTGTVAGVQRSVRHLADDRGEAAREAVIRWYAQHP